MIIMLLCVGRALVNDVTISKFKLNAYNDVWSYYCIHVSRDFTVPCQPVGVCDSGNCT